MNRTTAIIPFPAPIQAYLCALLPILAVHISFVLSASLGQIEWCFPYLDSCTSISNAGRKHPAHLIFKPTIIISAIFMLAYWRLTLRWLHDLNCANHFASRFLWPMGLYASIALIVYSLTLGQAEHILQLLRRLGIILFFCLTAFGHLLVVYCLSKKAADFTPFVMTGFKRQACVSYVLVGMGILSAGLSLFYDNYHQIDNAIEWCFALPMILQFAITGRTWQQTSWHAPQINDC